MKTNPKLNLPEGKEHFIEAIKPDSFTPPPHNFAVEALNKFPRTEDALANFTNQLFKALNNGEVNPLDLKIQFKALNMVLDVVKHRMDELALSECAKHEKKFEHRGFEVTTQEMGTTYDYSKTGDIVLEELEFEAKIWNERVKERQTMLKTLKEKQIFVYEETGQPFEVYPPVKKSTTSIVLKLKKSNP